MKHRSIQVIAFGGNQSQLATRDQSIVDSRLQTQSSLNCRICSKSKSGSSELPQNSLEDRSSIKLLILVSEWTNWPSIFLHVERPCPITNCARMHTERKRYSWHERCNGIWTGRNGTEMSPFFSLLLYNIFVSACTCTLIYKCTGTWLLWGLNLQI